MFMVQGGVISPFCLEKNTAAEAERPVRCEKYRKTDRTKKRGKRY